MDLGEGQVEGLVGGGEGGDLEGSGGFLSFECHEVCILYRSWQLTCDLEDNELENWQPKS